MMVLLPRELAADPPTPPPFEMRFFASIDRARPTSGRSRTVDLALERCDVTATEAPLSSGLERRKDALPRELVHRVGAQVEEPRELFAVEQHVFLLGHDAIPAQLALEQGRNLTAPPRTVKERSGDSFPPERTRTK